MGPYETPWLVEKVQAFIRRYVYCSVDQLLALALWVLFTWVVDAFDVAPYLDVSSPVRECGKTRLFECLELVCKRPRRCTGHTEATLFRMAEAEHPTMFLDEIDSTFGKDPKLYAGIRGILDEGHRRGGVVPRMVGEGRRMELKFFEVFGPKAFAGIGSLPETVATRSIPIRLGKLPRTEHVERFRRTRAGAESGDIREALEAWSAAVVELLAETEPALPEELTDRQWDVWEPLFAIGDLADVGSESRKAAVRLHERTRGQVAPELLAIEHLRAVFNGHDRMATHVLLEELVRNEAGPWGAWWGADVDAGRTKGPASRLARLLRAFDVEPKQLRIEGRKERGERADLEPVWAAYLRPLTPADDGTSVHGTPDMAPDRLRTDVPTTGGVLETERLSGDGQ